MPKSKTSKKTRTLKSKGTKSKSVKKPPKSKTIRAKPTPIEPEETVVLIYANWCPHCQSMKPEWNEMKSRLGPMIETIEIEDSDFDKDMKIYKTLKLRGIPTTILVNKKGLVVSKHEGILKWGEAKVVNNITNLLN